MLCDFLNQSQPRFTEKNDFFEKSSLKIQATPVKVRFQKFGDFGMMVYNSKCNSLMSITKSMIESRNGTIE